jgi:hypothetical protein
VSTSRETSLAFATSALMARARRPTALICEQTSCASTSRLRKFTATSTPAFARAKAIARPMPRLAPLTRAILPPSSLLMSFPFYPVVMQLGQQ